MSKVKCEIVYLPKSEYKDACYVDPNNKSFNAVGDYLIQFHNMIKNRK